MQFYLVPELKLFHFVGWRQTWRLDPTNKILMAYSKHMDFALFCAKIKIKQNKKYKNFLLMVASFFKPTFSLWKLLTRK